MSRYENAKITRNVEGKSYQKSKKSIYIMELQFILTCLKEMMIFI